MVIYIYCAGGFGKEVKDIAWRVISGGGVWSSIVFVDDMTSELEKYGCPVISFENLTRSDRISKGEFVIANGEPRVRDLIFDKLMSHGVRVASLIDSSAIISPSASIEKGVIVAPFCSVSSNASLGVNAAVNTMSIIGHDVSVGRHSVVSSMVNLGGASSIGERSYIGMGALVKEGVRIGSNAIVGMGSVVYNDIPDGVIALGNPARVMRQNTQQTVFKKN